MSGPPICTSRPADSAPRRRAQVFDYVVDPDRLGRGAKPGRSDHHGQASHEMAQRPVGLALGADDHRRAEVRQRRPIGRQSQRRLVAAAQVPGDASSPRPPR